MKKLLSLVSLADSLYWVYTLTYTTDLTMKSSERKCGFQCIDCGMTDEEAAQESSRCLRCDHFGYGIFKGGRVEKW